MMNNMLNHKTGNSRYSGNTGSGFTAGSPFWMLLACALLAGLLLLLPGASVAEEARDLTADCTYSWSKGSTKRMDVLYDHDYEFFSGEVVGKTDSNNYVVRGLEDHKISVLFGKKEYNAGDKAIIARIKDDLNLISED